MDHDEPEMPLRLPGRPGGPDRRDRLRASAAACASVLMAAVAITAVGTVTGVVLPPEGRISAIGAVPRTALTPAPAAAPSQRAAPVVAGVATTVRPRPSAAPTPSAAQKRARARQQALDLEALLRRSNAGRRSLAVGLYRLDSCPRAADAGRDHVRAALDNRVQLLGMAANAPVDAIPDGARVHALLLAMWSSSRDADGDYLTWAATVGAGPRCVGDRRLRAVADARSRRARAAKREFVAAWNARVARPLDLPTYASGRL